MTTSQQVIEQQKEAGREEALAELALLEEAVLSELSPLEQLSLMKLSYSRLNTFNMCEARYFYQYIAKYPDSTNPAALLGNVVHKVLENQLEIGKEISEDQEEEYYADFQEQLLAYDPEGIIGNDLQAAGKLMLKEFLARHSGERFDIIGKEAPFAIIIGGALFTGFIDRVDATGKKVYLIDFKSGKREVAAKAVMDDLQLGIYALAAKKIFPDYDIYAELYYLRTGRQKGHLFTEDDLCRIEEKVIDVVQRIRNRTDFRVASSKGPCYICPYADPDICSVGAKRIGAPR